MNGPYDGGRPYDDDSGPGAHHDGTNGPGDHRHGSAEPPRHAERGEPHGRSDPGCPDDPSGSGGPEGPGDADRTGDPDGPGTPGSPDRRHGGRSAARIPVPRVSVEDGGRVLPEVVPVALEHQVLTSLLGAWALAACSPEEGAAVEAHLGACEACADEALRLREAVGLLQRPESLDLDPALRTRVLEGCLERRPSRIPVPGWAAPYDAETARLDALLQDFGGPEWHAPVRLRWFEADGVASRRTTVAGVLAHLLAVDGLVAVALGLADPLGDIAAPAPAPAGRTEAYWRASHYPPTRAVRAPWREQSHGIVRTVAFTGEAGRMPVSYGDFVLPLHDAMLDRAFECWVHAEDIADAVDYPYQPPSARHLNQMIDLAARMLPGVLAARRRAGPATPGERPRLVAAGEPGRSLRLEIEGSGGGEWLIPLDSPGAVGSAEYEVAHVVLDGVEFCRLAAGHVPPADAAAGQLGDRDAIRDVLFAAASLSRM